MDKVATRLSVTVCATPGTVSSRLSTAAAAAVLKRELTVPGVAQTVTLSRVARSSPGGIAVDKVATRLSVTVCATPFPVLRRR
ncbi:hypothetical protein MAHJHV45_48390 [Mycobacterium avium subsp. hominissuis]